MTNRSFDRCCLRISSIEVLRGLKSEDKGERSASAESISSPPQQRFIGEALGQRASKDEGQQQNGGLRFSVLF
ncbi:hypothetical protein [Paenibacillus sp. FSL R7-0652]|uniref:Uncharacterized protein n=1 Tax=Paenibacillus sp. AN1007 TaxID=3151385 RepID=A0AAU8N9M0_9BACL